jgi:hypothetical protein
MPGAGTHRDPLGERIDAFERGTLQVKRLATTASAALPAGFVVLAAGYVGALDGKQTPNIDSGVTAT